MLTRADRHRCLANAHRILRPGGRLVLNVFHPSVSFMRRYQGESEGAFYELGRWDLEDGGRLTALESSRFDTVEQRVHTRLRWIEERPGGGARVTEEDLELGYVWRDELVLHLEAAGFAVEHLWGGFDRAPLTGEGQEMVAVARK
jgi:SAM-dependent methyltransferase